MSRSPKAAEDGFKESQTHTELTATLRMLDIFEEIMSGRRQSELATSLGISSSRVSVLFRRARFKIVNSEVWVGTNTQYSQFLLKDMKVDREFWIDAVKKLRASLLHPKNDG